MPGCWASCDVQAIGCSLLLAVEGGSERLGAQVYPFSSHDSISNTLHCENQRAQ